MGCLVLELWALLLWTIKTFSFINRSQGIRTVNELVDELLWEASAPWLSCLQQIRNRFSNVFSQLALLRQSLWLGVSAGFVHDINCFPLATGTSTLSMACESKNNIKRVHNTNKQQHTPTNTPCQSGRTVPQHFKVPRQPQLEKKNKIHLCSWTWLDCICLLTSALVLLVTWFKCPCYVLLEQLCMIEVCSLHVPCLTH